MLSCFSFSAWFLIYIGDPTGRTGRLVYESSSIMHSYDVNFFFIRKMLAGGLVGHLSRDKIYIV